MLNTKVRVNVGNGPEVDVLMQYACLQNPQSEQVKRQRNDKEQSETGGNVCGGMWKK